MTNIEKKALQFVVALYDVYQDEDGNAYKPKKGELMDGN